MVKNPALMNRIKLAGLLLACMYLPQCLVQGFFEGMPQTLVLPGAWVLLLADFLPGVQGEAAGLWLMGLTAAGGFATAWWIAERGDGWIVGAGALLLFGSIASAMVLWRMSMQFEMY